MGRAEDLRADYDLLGSLLAEAEGSGAAAIVRERRLIGELLEALERPKVVPLVDQVGERRKSKARDPGSASRGRKSG